MDSGGVLTFPPSKHRILSKALAPTGFNCRQRRSALGLERSFSPFLSLFFDTIMCHVKGRWPRGLSCLHTHETDATEKRAKLLSGRDWRRTNLYR